MHDKKGTTQDIIVLGAGASGMLCAATAAQNGRQVLLLEHNDAPGRKLAVTGGGKCNFSNRSVQPSDYVSENKEFCRSALSRFGAAEAVKLVQSAGIDVEERDHGQLFCQRSAKDLSAFLRRLCGTAGCAFAFGEKARRVERCAQQNADSGARFTVQTQSSTFFARSLVIATGGPAWPQVGATGTGFEVARAMGHALVAPRPALAGLVMPESWPLAGLAGISAGASICVLPQENAAAQKDEQRNKNTQGKKRASPIPNPAAVNLPLLFTHRGISGPAALQASLYWRSGMALCIDFLPHISLEAQLDAPGAGKLACGSLVRRHMPERLALALLPPELAKKPVARLSREERNALHAALCRFYVRPCATEGFSKAEVTAGGVSTEHISSRSMQSALAPGLFFCGEVLDVTGRLGGYNLHWAFASALAAGEALAHGS